MQLSLKLSDKALILVLVPVAFMVIFVTVLYQLMNEAEAARERSEREKEIAATTNTLMAEFYNVGATLISYAATRDDMFKQRYDEITTRIPSELRTLMDLVGDEPRGRKQVARVTVLSNRMLEILDSNKSALDEGTFNVKSFAVIVSRQQLSAILKDLMAELTDFEKMEAKSSEGSPDASEHLRLAVRQFVLLGMAGSILVALTLAWFFNRGTTGRLEILMDNTIRLGKKAELNPLLTGRDEIAHLDQVFHDMAAALAEADRRKQELEKLKQEFVAMVSHDLRTPLTSVQGSLDLLERGLCGKLPEEADQRVSVARRNIKRSITLINDLLDLEKLEAGKMELAIIRLRLSDVIEQSVESVATLAEKREIKIEANPCPFEIFADRERLIRVLVNLLSNAVKFSPDQGVITVSTMRDDEFTTVKVSDQGRGVPATHRETIFERYRQVSISDEKEKGGTGLGLPICKEIIQLHGGAIGVESEEGKGSTFWFTVPSAQSGW